MITSGRRRALSSGAVVTLLLGVGLAASSPSAVAKPTAKTFNSLTFQTSQQLLNSSTHKKLFVAIYANEQTSSAQTSSFANVSVSRKGFAENHGWSFSPFKVGSLKYNPSTGKGSLNSGKQLGPFGKLALRMKASGKAHVQHCGTMNITTQPVNVQGAWTFNTRTKGKSGWGKVKVGRSHHFHGANSIVYNTGTPDQCGNNFVLPCFKGVTWSAFKQAAGTNNTSLGGNISKHSTLFASRNVALKKPSIAHRSDSVNVPGKMSFKQAKGKATVSVGAKGPVSGSARLLGPKSSPPSGFPCGRNPQRTQTSTSWSASYKNGKSPLTVHEQIEGNIKLPNLHVSSSGETSINKSTVH